VVTLCDSCEVRTESRFHFVVVTLCDSCEVRTESRFHFVVSEGSSEVLCGSALSKSGLYLHNKQKREPHCMKRLVQYLRCVSGHTWAPRKPPDINSQCQVCPVPTAWRVLGLRMEERPPAMEGSCEYIE
jgi:hypothetical protein